VAWSPGAPVLDRLADAQPTSAVNQKIIAQPEEDTEPIRSSPRSAPVPQPTRPFWIAGAAAIGDEVLDVVSPHSGRPAGRTTLATADQVEAAVAAAHAARAECAATPAHVRAAALDHASRRLSERSEEIAGLITAESGKPLKWSRLEVARAVSTFRWGAEESRRWSGTLQRLDTDPAATGRMALVRRSPRGPVLGIAPFNFPLNLVAHKVAPAIAVGAPIVLKPAPATPLSALLLGEILAETDHAPAGRLVHRLRAGRLVDP
jgi:acyl-CoA reductase-like NAD-dependent aldehyde dehydrogenase